MGLDAVLLLVCLLRKHSYTTPVVVECYSKNVSIVVQILAVSEVAESHLTVDMNSTA